MSPLPTAWSRPRPADRQVIVACRCQATDRDEAWAWLAAERRALLAAIDLAVEHGWPTHAWQLAWSVNTYLDRVGAWPDQSRAQESALRAATAAGDRDGQARAHRNRAVACLRLGAYEEARDHLERSRQLYAELGDHPRALDYCGRALAQQQTGNRYWEVHAWDSLGCAHTTSAGTARPSTATSMRSRCGGRPANAISRPSR